MAGSLRRVLRIRSMQEEIRRLELEAEASALRVLETRVEQAAEDARASRQRWFQSLTASAAPAVGEGNDPPANDTAVAEESHAYRGDAALSLVSSYEIAVQRASRDRASARRTSDDRWELESPDLQTEERLMAEDGWQLAVWRRSVADARRPAQQAAFEQAREEFLASRRTRLEVETLVQAASVVERRRGDRREQRQLDDWFQSQPGERARRGRRSSDE